MCYIQSQESTPDIKKKSTEVLCSPLKGLFLLGRKLMKNSLHPLLFPSLIEKYYFNFVWIFLITMGVKICLTRLHSSRRNCAGIYCKSCKVNFHLYRFQYTHIHTYTHREGGRDHVCNAALGKISFLLWAPVSFSVNMNHSVSLRIL